jgi:hypothetical protein
MLESLFKLFFARWPVLILLALLGAVGSYLTIQKYGKQSFTVEGMMTYSGSEDYVQRKVFPPLKIETVSQLLRSPEVIEQAIKELDSPIRLDMVMRQLRVQIVQMSDNFAVAIDSSETENSSKLVNRMMELAQSRYLKQRNDTFQQAITRAENELQNAEKAHQESMTKLREALAHRNVGDPKLEYESVSKEIGELSSKVKELESSEDSLKAQIETLIATIAEQSKPSNPAQPEVNDLLTPEQQAAIVKAKGDLATAESDLKFLRGERDRKRGPAERNIIPAEEYRKAIQDCKNAEEKVDTLKKVILALEKKPDPKNPLPLLANDPLADMKKMLSSLRLDLATLPFKLSAAKRNLTEKRERLQELSKARAEIEPFEQATTRTGTLLSERTRERSELDQIRSKISDPHTSELKIRSLASSSASATSSNYLKIAAAVFGVLFMLYLGYLAAIELPRVTREQAPLAPMGAMPSPPAPQPVQPPAVQQVYNSPFAPSKLPVPVLGRFAPVTTTQSGRFISPAGPSQEVHTLADGIAQKFQEPGSIVLFTPMGEGVQVEKLVSELSRHYARAGESVLLFDARGVSSPLNVGSTGASSPGIDAYLKGKSEDAAACFTPTQFPSVEYTRGDITHTATGGAMAMYRFRQLLDEMRNRYSKVLMIGPTARHVDDLEMLTAFSEGVVLVVQDQANPNDVNAYVEAMKTADAPIFGAVVVGNQMR